MFTFVLNRTADYRQAFLLRTYYDLVFRRARINRFFLLNNNAIELSAGRRRQQPMDYKLICH